MANKGLGLVKKKKKNFSKILFIIVLVDKEFDWTFRYDQMLRVSAGTSRVRPGPTEVSCETRMLSMNLTHHPPWAPPRPLYQGSLSCWKGSENTLHSQGTLPGLLWKQV